MSQPKTFWQIQKKTYLGIKKHISVTVGYEASTMGF